MRGIGRRVAGPARRQKQESTQIATVTLLSAAVPFFFILQITADPSSLLARTLTWCPPTAAVTLLMRIGLEGISVAERSAAILWTVLTAVLMLFTAAVLFRARVLTTRRLSFRDLW